MFATLAFVRAGDVDDTFALAAALVHDHHDLVRKVVGGMLREAGKQTDHEPTPGTSPPAMRRDYGGCGEGAHGWQ
jgi:3-methyladenine DNA glycosylase AlkD